MNKKNLKIVQLHSVIFKGDAVSNVIMALDKINKDIGWNSYIVADLFSEYKGIPVWASADYNKSSALSGLPYLIGRFIKLDNKIRWIKEYMNAKKEYKPNVAKKIIEASNIRIWHYGAFYNLFRYFHENDILFYHGITYPYLGYNSEFNIYSKTMLQSILDMNPSIIVQSKFIKQSIADLGFKKNNIHILPLFHKYNLSYQDKSVKEVHLVTWGRYALNKRVPELVDMANKYKINLRVFGDNNQVKEFKDQYKEAIKFNINNYANLSGKVQDFEAELNQANIYISNSYHEGFNMPLIEAEAHSIPVLARKGTAMDELVKEGYNGYLFSDINEVPSLINKIMKNYKQFSYNAWKHSKNYTYGKFKQNYLKIFKNYLSTK